MQGRTHKTTKTENGLEVGVMTRRDGRRRVIEAAKVNLAVVYLVVQQAKLSWGDLDGSVHISETAFVNILRLVLVSIALSFIPFQLDPRGNHTGQILLDPNRLLPISCFCPARV